MARKPVRGRTGSRGRANGFGKLLVGLAAGAGLTMVCLAGYFYLGKPPVSVVDRAALWEPLIQAVPLRSRARAEAKPPPFAASEEVFEGGAHVYRAQCAQCHGVPGHDAPLGRAMLPHAQQFFAPRERRGAAGESAGELFWKTAFGIRRSGMPAYNRTLTNTELWQVSLLLHSAGEDLPDPVHGILQQGVPPPQPTVVQP